ncbi:NusB antitermination factor [Andreprevotia lacus DSM 23236]|jgi:N utilization substance protein B|uniref:Transcription antitermination protein NusB n=1 Tax=Andreprevotia lacus DSM 23236 TaxID=1121001 RepID=A0A1W1XNM9_9NEIS|nr:transcription antitermination factor NusB [Andreprevotia lacus]SMC25484.1 NusB antitermination factor [Andreprevotia lacus DSM 23236]
MSEQQTPAAKPAKPKSPRRRAREFAVQGIYQWQLTGDLPAVIERNLRDSDTSFAKADEALFRSILFGALKDASALKEALVPHIDRDFAEVSPVEAAVLLAAAFEIIHTPETPYPVIVNESIELAKTFGGSDGHKFVNGVLDKLAAAKRPEEIESIRAKRRG